MYSKIVFVIVCPGVYLYFRNKIVDFRRRCTLLSIRFIPTFMYLKNCTCFIKCLVCAEDFHLVVFGVLTVDWEAIPGVEHVLQFCLFLIKINKIILCAQNCLLYIWKWVPVFRIWFIPICVLFWIDHFNISLRRLIIYHRPQNPFIIKILNLVILNDPRFWKIVFI